MLMSVQRWIWGLDDHFSRLTLLASIIPLDIILMTPFHPPSQCHHRAHQQGAVHGGWWHCSGDQRAAVNPQVEPAGWWRSSQGHPDLTDGAAADHERSVLKRDDYKRSISNLYYYIWKSLHAARGTSQHLIICSWTCASPAGWKVHSIHFSASAYLLISFAGNFDSFMQKEIFEQPETVVNTMRGRICFDSNTGDQTVYSSFSDP